MLMVVGALGKTMKQTMKILGVIPARFKSTRFEGKPLALIDGVPMIKRTYLQVAESSFLSDIVVATEDSRIFDYCTSENIPVIMTSSTCLTGTDRLAEVSEKIQADLYVNIQGDEPVIDPKSIEQVVELYHATAGKYEIYNLYKVITDVEEVNSNTIVKVIVNEQDEVMYMSRLPIPYSNGGYEAVFKQQIPVYAFTKKALKTFSSYQKTLNEKIEDVEILRFVDLGYKVKMAETKVDSIAVDVPSDIGKVERFLKSHI
jgi:3-deoxy-manno-octulosonate cytidylyltransferase (CMP-KDO synthetase)